MIPNVEFWMALPALVKDGVVYLYRNIILVLFAKMTGGGYSSVP
jgi:hypothetical protein